MTRPVEGTAVRGKPVEAVRRLPGTVRAASLWALLALCLVFGGNSRADFAGLLVLYPVGIVLAGLVLILPGELDFADVRAPLLLLGGLALLALLQLIPLPSPLWTALPNRQMWTVGARMAGVDLGWQPVSIAPDLTLDFLVSLCVPASVLVALAGWRPDRDRYLVLGMLGAIIAAAVLGGAQFAGGENGAFNLNPLGTPGEAAGFFANRNHHALFLTLGVPLAGLAVATSPTAMKRPALAQAMFGSFGLFLAVAMLLTGSRAGVPLFLGGLLLTLLLILRDATLTRRRGASSAKPMIAAGVLVTALALVGIAAAGGRMTALNRLSVGGLEGDLRWRALPVLLRIWGDHWVFGTGFGTFNPLYRIYEPLALLQQSYLNHAHNDLLELAMTGGLPALIITGVFAVWLVQRLALQWMQPHRSPRALLARAGGIVVVQILGASLFDYPLRTPLIAVIFVMACVWLARRPQSVAESPLPT